MTRVLLFDVDGVLADTEHLHKKALATAAMEAGYSVKDADTSTTTAKLRAAGVSEAEIPAIYARKRKLYEEWIPSIPKNQELARVLHRIAQRHPLGACTNSNRVSCSMLLQHLGVFAIFGTIVTSSDVPSGKPAPDVYVRAMKNVGTTPGNVCIFEDSDVGIEAARRAGASQIIQCTTETLLEELQPWLW